MSKLKNIIRVHLAGDMYDEFDIEDALYELDCTAIRILNDSYVDENTLLDEANKFKVILLKSLTEYEESNDSETVVDIKEDIAVIDSVITALEYALK